MSARSSLLMCAALLFGFGAQGAGNGYVGREVCATCHQEIARTQVRTNMARTWQGAMSSRLPANYAETLQEGPSPEIKYSLIGSGGRLQYRVQMPGRDAEEFPIESIVGGDRHGISFLLRIPALDGSPLPVARLIEARYFHSSAGNRLAFSLGFPEDKPLNFETAFGRVLTPYLEQRCLGCHVSPRQWGSRLEAGVSCENCHGPGQAHVAEAGKPPGAQAKELAIVNPGKFPVAERMTPCAQCHAGSSYLEDPMPEDVLISDQVTALKNSECWRQSGGQITCINCHNPHQDASKAVLVARSEQRCAECHSLSVAHHAAICPVNRAGGCVNCHMADEVRGAFTIAEHWIRIPARSGEPRPTLNPAFRTTVTPRREFLRAIVAESREKASALLAQVLSGASFFDVARASSTDAATAPNGGFLGDVSADRLDPAWAPAALKLAPGGISDVLEANGKYVVLQRMPSNFRFEAEALFNQGMELRKQGKRQEAAAEFLAALKIYPRLLRALTYLGVTYGESGNPQTSAAILGIATREFPQDAGAHFNLGIAYGSLGKPEEIAEYRRTVEIDPDYVPAYLNWGAALYAAGNFDEAIQVYRNGLNVNPLVASLHYSLALALEKSGKAAQAAAELALAGKIDPGVGNAVASR